MCVCTRVFSMAMYEGQLGISEELTSDEIQEIMVQKAQELFTLCDKEQKGFINKLDMQRMQSELPLTPELLEQVFDSLDEDKNGYLTMKEFTEGFGSFVGMRSFDSTEKLNNNSINEKIYGEDENDEIEERHFNEMLCSVGAKSLFDDESTIKALWIRMRKEEEPDVLENFEDFLCKVSKEIKRSHGDFKTLEAALKSKTSSYDEEVKRLYEEMEYQIKKEKDTIINKEKAKERMFREEMEKELTEKDGQLQELISRHKDLEKKMSEVNFSEAEAKQTNDRLLREKEELETKLRKSQEVLEEQKSYIQQLRQQQKDEKRERAKVALKLTEGIAMERESLVKQLDFLRDMNRKLRDDKDEAEARRVAPETFPPQALPNVLRPTLNKRGSILSDYFSPHPRRNSQIGNFPHEDDDIYEMEELDCTYTPNSNNHFYHQNFNHNNIVNSNSNNCKHHDSTNKRNAWINHKQANNFSSSSTASSTIMNMERDYQNKSNNDIETNNYLNSEPFQSFNSATEKGEMEIDDNSESVITVQSAYQDENSNSHQSVVIPAEAKTPERVFKIVFVGDSGVGKSSFIHRFCNDNFQPAFSATIGVDFQVKSIEVDGHVFALQLWDTAGQERFRSITKQYFRKADGVLIMYDVNSEISLVNVRNWMFSVKESVDESTVVVIVGNKIDLCTDESRRTAQSKIALRIAEDNDSLFYETSAKDGTSVKEAMFAMACILKEKEDEELEKAVELKVEPNKKTCCS